MSYFPTSIIKYYDSFHEEALGNEICRLGKALVDSLPVSIVGDSFQVRSTDGLTTNVTILSPAASPPSFEPFRYLRWRLMSSKGAFGFRVFISTGSFPSLTFECDFMAGEGKYPSERSIGDSGKVLVNSNIFDVVETPTGYYGFPQAIFLRYLLRCAFPAGQVKNTCGGLTILQYLQMAESGGIVSRHPIQLRPDQFDAWSKGVAARLNVDIREAQQWLATVKR